MRTKKEILKEIENLKKDRLLMEKHGDEYGKRTRDMLYTQDNCIDMLYWALGHDYNYWENGKKGE